MRTFRSPDGVQWGVEITSPSFSNAVVYFRHPDGRTSRRDRYNWYLWQGPEARNVTARLKPAEVMERISDDDLMRLFRRSMPITERRVGDEV